MYRKSTTLSLVASSMLVGTLLLSGCGGGGGSTTVNTTTSSVTLSGTATDELIVDGVVTAHAGSASGNVLATGRTDRDGVYTLSVEGYSGVVVVKVECDARSSLYFPETGATEPCDPNLRLYSAAPVSGSGEVKVSVTPLTQAMFALATGGNENAPLDARKVDDARNKIALAMGGIDPVSADPIQNPVYKTIVEAFQQTARETNTTTLQVIEQFAEDAQDGVIGDQNQEIVKAIAENIADENVSVPFVEAVENNETYAPPANAAGLDDIAQAKDFFDSLRTQGETLLKSGGFFDNEAKAIEAAAENVTLNADLAAKAIDNTLTALIDAIDEGVDDYAVTVAGFGENNRTVAVHKESAETWRYTFIDNVNGSGSTVAEGHITVPDVNYSDVAFVDTFTALKASFDGTIPATYFYEQTQNAQSFKADVTLTRTDEGADAAIDNIELFTSDGTKLGISALTAKIGYDYNGSDTEDPVTPKYLKLETLTLNGALDRSYSASGTLNVGYTLNSSLAQNGGITETYTTEAGGRLDCANLDGYSGTVSTTLDGTPVSMDVQNGYFRLQVDGQYEFNDIEDFLRLGADNFDYVPDDCQEPTFALDYTNYRSDEKIGNSGYLPNRLAFAGDIRNESSGSELVGNVAIDLLNAAAMDLSDLDHVNEDPKLKVILSGTLKRAQLDDTRLNVTYQNSLDAANKINGHSFQTAYVYGSTAVNMAGSFDKEMKNGTLAISSGNGLSITIRFKNGDIDYDNTTPLTKDGRVVGYLGDETGPRIKYIDGTFEALY